MKNVVKKFVKNRVQEEGVRDDVPVLAIIEHIEDILERELRVSEIRIMGSSGSSVVVLVKCLPLAFQHYSFHNNYERVHQFVSAMEKNPEIAVDVTVSSGFGRRAQRADIPFKYNLFDYLVEAEYWIPELQTIVWEFIETMQSRKKPFIEKNKYKILWDLGKALEGIHQNGFVHGDATLDNSGMKSGNFIYFDFDMSKSLRTERVDPNSDFQTLINSIEFHLDEKISLLPHNYFNSLIGLVKNKIGFDTFQETVKYLEELPIITEQTGGGQELISNKKFALPEENNWTIYGNKNCGYTQLALNYVRDNPERFKNVIFYDASEIWPDKSFGWCVEMLL